MFGDGGSETGTGSQHTVTHTYSAAGTFTVNLTVTDPTPIQTGTKLKQIVVAPLVADFSFSPTNPIAGQTVTFTGSATGGTPSYTFSWAFGDGTSSEDPSPTHTYNVTGLSATFTVVLVACASPESCDSTSREITFYNVGLIALLGGVSAAVLVAGVLLLLLRRRRRKAHDVPVLENNPDAEIADAPPRRRGGNR